MDYVNSVVQEETDCKYITVKHFYLFQFMANELMILHYKTKTRYSNSKGKKFMEPIGDMQPEESLLGKSPLNRSLASLSHLTL